MRIQVKIGNSINWGCVYKDENNTPIDLTGYEIRSQARISKGSDDILFDLSTGNGITITDIANGEFELKILDTTAFTRDLFLVDILYTINGETISTDTFELEMIQNITV